MEKWERRGWYIAFAGLLIDRHFPPLGVPLVIIGIILMIYSDMKAKQ